MTAYACAWGVDRLTAESDMQLVVWTTSLAFLAKGPIKQLIPLANWGSNHGHSANALLTALDRVNRLLGVVKVAGGFKVLMAVSTCKMSSAPTWFFL